MKRKRSLQTTLTGKAFQASTIHNPSLARNQTLCCRFEEAFCSVDDRPRAESVTAAQEEWKTIRGDVKVVEKRIGELKRESDSDDAVALAGNLLNSHLAKHSSTAT